MEEKQKSTLSFSLKLCSDKAAFEARPLRRVSLRMVDAKRLFEKAEGYNVVVYTPHIMILAWRSVDVTLSKDGRVLIKRVRDQEEAALVAQNVFRLALKTAV